MPQPARSFIGRSADFSFRRSPARYRLERIFDGAGAALGAYRSLALEIET